MLEGWALWGDGYMGKMKNDAKCVRWKSGHEGDTGVSMGKMRHARWLDIAVDRHKQSATCSKGGLKCGHDGETGVGKMQHMLDG